MNTLLVSTRELLEGLQRRRGFYPAAAQFTDGELAQQASLLNRALRVAWEYCLWPQLLVTAQVQFRESWDAAVSYARGEQVFLDDGEGGQYWESTVGGNVGRRPGVCGGWRRCEGEMVRSVVYADYGMDEVDLSGGVFARNPDLVREAGVLVCERAPWGLNVTDDVFVARPWVRFRPLPPAVTSEAWQAQRAYRPGELVYAGGDSYVCIAPCTGEDPLSPSASSWALQAIPELFRDFVEEWAVAQYAQEEDGRARALDRAEAFLRRLRSTHTQQVGVRGRACVRVLR